MTKGLPPSKFRASTVRQVLGLTEPVPTSLAATLGRQASIVLLEWRFRFRLLSEWMQGDLEKMPALFGEAFEAEVGARFDRAFDTAIKSADASDVPPPAYWYN